MPRNLSYGQKIKQALSFQRRLTELGNASGKITRERINQIFDTDFKPKWDDNNPEEPSLAVSQLRYLLVTKGYLLKRTKDEFVISHPSNDADTTDVVDPTASKPKRRPRRRKKIAHVAVDQHLSLFQNERPKTDISQMQPCEKGFACRLCSVTVATEAEANKHVGGRKHRVQQMLSRLKQDRESLVQNKRGILVTCDDMLTNGTIKRNVEEGKTSLVTITVTNESAHRQVVFTRCELLRRVRVFQLSDVRRVTDGINTFTLNPGMSYQITVTILANNVGVFHAAMAFSFKIGDGSNSDGEEEEEEEDEIIIVRYLSVKCENSLIEKLQPEVEYLPPPRVSSKPADVEVVEGLPLPKNSSEHLERAIELKPYYVNKNLRSFLNHGMAKNGPKHSSHSPDYEAVAEETRKILSIGLDRTTHKSRFDTLLLIEEVQMEVDIRKYDMVGVTLDRESVKPRMLVLKVPGLAENRPSVLKGDCLYVRTLNPKGKPEGCEYKGHVHDVGPDRVYLGFSQKLVDKYIPNMKFSVRFEFHRLPLRVQHRAVEMAAKNSLGDLLFPTPQSASSAGSVPAANIRFFDQRVAANKEQQAAVHYILEGSSRPAPYLIFGPPGTGKTVTMVEAIKQVATRISSSHVLVCAPSNSAADLLAERLLAHLDKSWIYRMHAASRAWGTVPEKVRACSNYDPSRREFCYPSKTDLYRYRVIVCTLVTAGRIVSAKFPTGHFTHVFVDEAGHAAEPEVLVPISRVLDCDLDPDAGLDLAVTGQCVLAGDPQQLGAVIRSPIAIEHGLGMSFLERLMTKCDVYKRLEKPTSSGAPYNPKVLIKLVRNYRSHPAILSLPNEAFYDNELEIHADPLVRNSMCRWDGLPKQNFPVLFHGLTAQEKREERSPSFFNPAEVSVVVTYVENLLSARGLGIRLSAKDIGIISPYRKQVQKIKKALQLRKVSGDIKVGSVEEFQGQERHVIIISTVRTSPEYLAMDLEFKLGFLKNPKRFNVSVTRAKALLIVVGNPYVLSKDQHWNAFLEYCRKNKAYTGVDYEPEEERLEDIIQRFQSLKLDEKLKKHKPQQISLKEIVEEPEWRKDD